MISLSAASLSPHAIRLFLNSQKIEVDNQGEVNSFLGISVTCNYCQHAISIGQLEYIDRLLAKYNISNAKSTTTPFEKNTKLKLAVINDKLCNLKLYQELTGSPNHLAVFTKPDIAFAIFKLYKFNANPTTILFKATLYSLIPQVNSQLLHCLQALNNSLNH